MNTLPRTDETRPEDEAISTAAAPAERETWLAIVVDAARQNGDEMDLATAYAMVQDHPRAATNANWKAKVRQILTGSAFERIERGSYRLKA